MKALALLLLTVAVHAEDAQTYIRKTFAQYKGATAGELWLVAQGTNRVDVLNLLAHNPDEKTRYVVALNINAPMEALRHLASDPSEKIRAAVASQSFRTTDDIQWMLSDDKSRIVISDLAPQTTVPDILEKIRAAYSDDGEILWELAVNRAHASNPTLEKIAHCRFANAAELARQVLDKRGPDFAQVYEEKVVGIKR